MRLFKLAEVVDHIVDVTQIDRGITYNRVRNWIAYGWITGIIHKQGEGPGTRRLYSRQAIIEGAILSEVAQFSEGPVLQWVGTLFRLKQKKIEKVLKDPQKRLWLVVTDKQGTQDAFKPYLMEITRGQDDSDALDVIEQSDRLWMVNLGRVLGRIKS